MNNTSSCPVVRPIEVIRGYKSIGQAFGRSEDTVRDWKSKGAPIFTDDPRGRVIAEKSELWEWYKRNACIAD